jgi:hypothetical protein
MTGKRSGDATIFANITYNDGTIWSLTTSQRVNHNIPQYASFIYPAMATVGNITQIDITLTDKYNNPIDNKNPADVHPLVLDATATGSAGFQNGTLFEDHIVLQTDAAGKASVNFRLSTIAGKNYFMLQPVGNINEPPYYITGMGDAMPVYISQTYPLSPSLPADGKPENYFTIDYTITDTYGNPVNTTLRFTADDGTSSLKITNPFTGKVRARFGPKDMIGHYTLTAATPANASVFCVDTNETGSCSQVVEFYNTTPVDLTITANPQGMASLDADSTSKSVIRARVMDEKGNPVTGELVRFSNATPTYPGGPYHETIPLYLSDTSATISAGYATINFTPGAFTDNSSDPLYKSNATGQVVVTATWTNRAGVDITRNVTLVWKNYPYLSISSAGNCEGSKVGDMINVTIALAGDGAALRPKPIDAMMVMDNSGSMSSTPKMSGPNGSQYKYYYSQVAGRTFVNKMNPATDQVGLVKYNAAATLAYNLSGNFAGVITAINLANLKGATNTRDALKLGIDNVVLESKNPKAIKAIILLTDGAYNQNGDPLAREKLLNRSSSFYDQDGDKEWTYFSDWPRDSPYQNMAYYAHQNNIRIYTITLGTDPQIQSNWTPAAGTWQIYDTMDQIAAQTHPKAQHFHATNGAELINIYETIAGILQETAGGDTQVALDFGHVNINDNLLDANITKYMNYTYYHNTSLAGYQPSDSTYFNKTKLNDDGTITLQSETLQDDTSNWAKHTMNFDVGTVKLNETWTVNFRLNLTHPGKIVLFGPDSASNIKFNDTSSNNATQNSFIPAIQCNVLEKRPEGMGDYNLSVYNLTDGLPTGATFFTQWPIEWKTTYDGNESAVEEIKYMNVNIPSRGWQMVDYGWAFIPAKSFDKPDYLMISTTDDVKWPPGDQFCIQITATADDVNGAAMSNQWCRTKAGSGGTQYIKLE